MLTEEKINANYLAYIKRLERYNCYSEQMINEIGEQIKNAPFTMTDSYGGAYKGGLVDVTLNILCRIGYGINERVLGKNGGDAFQFPIMAVNPDKLMRVLLLGNISKAVMFEPETEQWKLSRGNNYRFVDNPTAMKSGVRSAYMCQKYGIQLDEDEFETIMGMDDNDEVDNNFKTPLFSIVESTKNMANVILRQTWKKENNKQANTVEQ